MPILDKMTPLQLKKLRQELWDELRAVSPITVAQLELVDNVLNSREAEAGPFASCRIAAEAVDLFFNTYGDHKHTKKETRKLILGSGYTGKSPKAAGQQISDRMNYLLENDILTMKGELIGRNPKKLSGS